MAPLPVESQADDDKRYERLRGVFASSNHSVRLKKQAWPILEFAGCLLVTFLGFAFLFIIALLFGFGDAWTGCSGTVRTADGRPLPNAEVLLTLEDGSESKSTRSQADGTYGLHIGTRTKWNRRGRLDVSAEGYRTNSRQVDGDNHAIDVVMEPVPE